ncbi:MAG: translation initiation factor IF-1 [Candidatus Ryanbacteria bacterium CG10_big_fil_rev_8_21_14_0_10_43_42]|uniref:Translation initiation factor IF-1 n=1 Tax=Candidatus Ryanbacteria bacterium CG10_big_fil_rev_8_21_14_0_10_43_42 TaxID=1974864 RepID=A0A2M8KX20_9BACT|nr:MAG: translation initiation factor IF-1 [Candidatus Ryanbacteria bacterium CG10_big_fil_rev_8_21_14_0_10_43_42]
MAHNSDKIIKEGSVTETLPNTTFRVTLDDGGEILAHLGGKMRLHYIRVLLGDRVRIEMSPYDMSKGRIVHRL